MEAYTHFKPNDRKGVLNLQDGETGHGKVRGEHVW